jgi:hypothetical protein
MSVVVKGMRMPENCEKCPFLIEEDIDYDVCRQCGAGKNGYIYEEDIDGFPADCPLVDLGKHGDLIDRQKLIEDNKHLEYPTDGKYRRDRAWAVGFNAGARHCNEHAVYAKTVLEAEDG